MTYAKSVTKLSRPSFKRVGFGPRTPAPGPITFRLRLVGIHPVLDDSDQCRNSGVGFGPPQTYPRPNLLSPPASRDSPRPR